MLCVPLCVLRVTLCNCSSYLSSYTLVEETRAVSGFTGVELATK